MKVTTQLTQLRANYGNITDQEISEFTGIDQQQLTELENGEAEAITFTTLAKLCAFFECTPNDLLIIDWEEAEIDTTPPSPEELSKAREIIEQGFALAEAISPRPAAEIWAEFQAVRIQVSTELANSEQGNLMGQ